MKGRVLVLGAGGFIGRRVVAALAASDWAIPVAAGRRAAPAGATGESIQLDATDAGALRSALQDAVGVVNCVAGSADTIVRGAAALFDVARALPAPPRIVHLSSVAVYGEAEGEVDESTAAVGRLSDYGAAKVAAERAAAGAPAVILRPGIVYGPGSVQWTERIGQWLLQRRIGDLGPQGDGYCNLVYIDDTVDAILRALQGPGLEGRVFNLSLPDPPRWNEYFTRFAKALGAVPVARLSRRRLTVETKLLAPPLKIAQILAGKVLPGALRWIPEPVPPSALHLVRPATAHERCCSAGRARDALDRPPAGARCIGVGLSRQARRVLTPDQLTRRPASAGSSSRSAAA